VDEGSASTDIELLLSARRGNNRALCEIFQRYGDRAFRILKYDCHLDEGELTRALRATFLEIWPRTMPPPRGSTVSSWIVRTTIRNGRMELLSASSRGDGLPDRRIGLLSESSAPANLLEQMTPVEAEVSRRPFQERLAIALVERESIPDTEVADGLGVSTPRLWRLVASARRELQESAWRHESSGVIARIGRLARTGKWCPPGWVLNRAVTADYPRRVGWHLSECISCARWFVALTRVSARLSGLRRHEMSARLRNEVTVSLLAAPLGSHAGA
jgi:DNA-directed RNA polymerase specialized sigma24 family protein